MTRNENRITVRNGPWAGFACVPGVTYCNMRVNENGRTGSETTYTFEGEYDPITQQQAVVRRWGVFEMAKERIEGGTNYRLTCLLPFDENGREPANLTGVYELDVEMAQQNIYTCPLVQSVLTPNQIALVAQIVEDYKSGQDSSTSYDPITGVTTIDGGWSKAIGDIQRSILDSDAQNRAIQLFSSVVSFQTDGYITYNSVLKRTLYAALPGQVVASYEGRGKIWTTAELIDWEGINPAGILQLDPTSQWLKSPPNISAAAGQKTSLTYSYTETFKANGLMYEPYGSAELLYANVDDLPPLG